MPHIVNAKLKLAILQLGRFRLVSFPKRFRVKMAAGLLLALAALSFCPPLRAQSPDVKGASDETSSTIPPETGKYATQKTDLSTAFCDASRPECQAAKRAITERIAHDAEKNAQTSQTQQPAPAAAPPAAAPA